MGTTAAQEKFDVVWRRRRRLRPKAHMRELFMSPRTFKELIMFGDHSSLHDKFPTPTKLIPFQYLFLTEHLASKKMK